jgi:catechol 2,3-dioxygenase-like lactoylglutathione lyase family enzyme
MAVQLNHLLVWSRDQIASATFLADILGLPDPVATPPFTQVRVTNDVLLDYLSGPRDVAPQHYAFLVSETEFDEIFGRIKERGLDHWAGPGHSGPGSINTRDGGRGVYFDDPDGHALEILTRPYGG